jgi:hypothetical protein
MAIDVDKEREAVRPIGQLILDAYVLGFLASDAKPEWSTAASYRHCGAFTNRQMKDLREIFDMLARAAVPASTVAEEPPHYTEGVCHDGAAILRDGVPITISEILTTLNARPAATPEAVKPGADQ